MPTTPPTPVLRRLIAQVQARDVDAFDRLVVLTGDFVRTQCSVILRNHSFVDDAVQSTYFKVWNDAIRFDPQRGAPIAWLATLARNASVDVIRAEERAGERQRRVELMTPAVSMADPSTAVIQQHQVTRALDKLPPEERTAIHYAYFHDLTYRQVAERLSLPEGTVMGRIRRGLRRLSELLDEPAP
jgi:RNA polymerase sigma-70 factor (ECF subfamily)